MESERLKNSEALGSKSMKKRLSSEDFRAFLIAYKARVEREWEEKKKQRKEPESGMGPIARILAGDDEFDDENYVEPDFELENISDEGPMEEIYLEDDFLVNNDSIEEEPVGEE